MIPDIYILDIPNTIKHYNQKNLGMKYDKQIGIMRKFNV